MHLASEREKRLIPNHELNGLPLFFEVGNG